MSPFILARGGAGGLRPRVVRGRRALQVAVAALLGALAAPAAGQGPPPSSTLRWGSGYLDVPQAAVLPALALRAQYSAFWLDVPADPQVGPSGEVVGPGSARTGFAGDAAFSLGLFQRLELGTSVQSFRPREEGGNLFGVFGRALILDPSQTGLGLAVGARYLGAPDYGDGVDRAPTRLGFQDDRARQRYDDGRTLDTELSLYAVGTLVLPGVRLPWLPPNDVTLTAGYGNGLFQEGGDLTWYGDGDLGGWFFAGGWDVAAGPGRTLTLQGEHNGLDVNLGAELAWGDVRVGVHALGVNHRDASSAYRSRKLGASVTLTACPLLNRACTPRVRARPAPDTLPLPAPPPDTVLVTRPLLPPGTTGQPVRLCLATGRDAWVLVTTVGDTLVGPGRRSLAALPPGEALPGEYAASRPGFDPGSGLAVGGAAFAPVGEPEAPACAALVPWGEWQTVPVFRLREGGERPEIILLPIRPGSWQRYRRVEDGAAGSVALPRDTRSPT